MDTLLSIVVGVFVLLFGGAMLKAVNDYKKGFPSIDDTDKVRDSFRDRYYL